MSTTGGREGKGVLACEEALRSRKEQTEKEGHEPLGGHTCDPIYEWEEEARAMVLNLWVMTPKGSNIRCLHYSS